jgi:hypothetical protein
MLNSSSPKRAPLRKTYRIEKALIYEHDQRMKRAQETWKGQPICPDHYFPCKGECNA